MHQDPRFLKNDINGTMGCQQSHLRLWQKIYDSASLTNSSAPFAMVFEDDAMFNPNAFDDLDTRMQAVPDDADMILLGWVGLLRPTDHAGQGVYRATGPEREPYPRPLRDLWYYAC